MPVLEKLGKFKHESVKKYEITQRQLCKSMVKHPGRHCLFHWAVLVFFSVVVFLGGVFNLTALSETDFIIIEDQRVQNFLLARELNELVEASGNIEVQRTRSDPRFEQGGLFMYDVADGDIFTPENVQEMCEIESLFVNREDYPFFCPTAIPRGLDTICSSQILSFSFIFYGNELRCNLLTEDDINRTLSNLLVQQEDFLFDNFEDPKVVRSVLLVAGPLGEDSPPNKFFAESSGSVRDEQSTEGYSLLLEDYRDNLLSFFGAADRPIFGPFDTEFFTTGRSTLRTRVGGPLLEAIELEKVLFVDQLLSVGSFLVVLILVAAYMRSIVLAVVSMLSILLSLVAALFLFAVVLQIDYFTPLNILVLFLIAGIGADNVLVLSDAWRQSEDELKEDIGLSLREGQEITSDLENDILVNRLVYAYERAALAVSNTAITTFIAFLATAISPIPAIAGLGIFASLAILINWWFMFTVHPANLMWHYYVFIKVTGKAGDKKDEVYVGDQYLSFKNGARSVVSAFFNLERGVHDAALESAKRISMARFSRYSEEENERKLSAYELDAQPTRKKSALSSVNDRSPSVKSDIRSGVLSVKGAVPIPKLNKQRVNDAKQDDESNQGERSATLSLNAAQNGEVQSVMSSMISRPISAKPPKLGLFAKAKDEEVKKKFRCLDAMFAKYAYIVNETPFPIVCLVVVTSLLIFLGVAASRLTTPSSLESLFPANHMFGTFLLDFGLTFLVQDPSAFSDVSIIIGVENFDVSGVKKLSAEKDGAVITFDDNFDFSSQEAQDFLFRLCNDLFEFECDFDGCTQDTLFLDAIGNSRCSFESSLNFILEETPFTSTVVGAPGGPASKEEFEDLLSQSEVAELIDGKLRFIVVKRRLSMRRLQPLVIKEPVLDLLTEVIDGLRESAPPGLKSIVHSTEEETLLVTELALISGMFEGLGISLTASFFVLLIGTKSLRLAFLAISSVLGVAIAVLGTTQLQGGELGTAESVAGVFIIGLSVDYIVHVGHMFMHSTAFIDGEPNPNFGSQRLFHRLFKRNERNVYKTKDMLEFTVKKMGPTVLAGALTTFFSALFLSLCTFDFFGKMSNLLMLTVVYAVLLCFFLFVPLLRLFGPGKK